VNNNKAPFFGSNITTFKGMGKEFVAHVSLCGIKEPVIFGI